MKTEKTQEQIEYEKKWRAEGSKRRNSRLCEYNGKQMTFVALVSKLRRIGVSEPYTEAKNYLIGEEESKEAIANQIAEQCWKNRGAFPDDDPVFDYIKRYHKSFWDATMKGYLSPREAWDNEKIFKATVKNRMIHNDRLKKFPWKERIPTKTEILAGFNVSKLNPYVSIFSPKKVEKLIDTFLDPRIELIVDPFSGFSGRMVGSVRKGKKYKGWDVNETHVRESNELIKFLKLEKKATIEVEDLLTVKTPKVFKNSCLLTCSPYSDKEDWGNKNQVIQDCDWWATEVLERYVCDQYIFVVDKTDLYSDFVKEFQFRQCRGGTSEFFGGGKALILVLTKEDRNKICSKQNTN